MLTIEEIIPSVIYPDTTGVKFTLFIPHTPLGKDGEPQRKPRYNGYLVESYLQPDVMHRGQIHKVFTYKPVKAKMSDHGKETKP